MRKLIKNGFTLVELLVVVSVISILLLIAIPMYIESTISSKIRVFEINSKSLMFDINKSYISNNENAINIYKDVNQNAIDMEGKPENSKYEIDKSTNILKCTLKKEVFKGSEDYVIEYDVSTNKITQKPDNLPEGATDISTK